MICIPFEGSNLHLNAPPGMEENVYAVEAFAGKDGHGIDFVLTCWQPSQADQEAIAEGRPLWLKICGIFTPGGKPTMPPCALFTVDAQGDANV